MSSYLSSSANSDYPLDAAGSRTPNCAAVGAVSGVVRERTNFRTLARPPLPVPPPPVLPARPQVHAPRSPAPRLPRSRASALPPCASGWTPAVAGLLPPKPAPSRPPPPPPPPVKTLSATARPAPHTTAPIAAHIAPAAPDRIPRPFPREPNSAPPQLASP